jgi:hypothetical protein
MKSLRFCLSLFAVGILPSLGFGPRLAAKDLDSADLYDKVVRSCVYILTPLKGGHAEGSGSLIDVEKRIVVTNYHVVEEQEKVFVVFPVFIKGELLTDKEKYKQRVVNQGLGIKGTVLCRDKSRDLAFVQVESVPEGATAIRLAKTSPRPNAPVWQIGNAGAIKQAFRVSRGEVSAVGHVKDIVGAGAESFQVDCKMITATNPINSGDSGGPLYDKRGYQVGVSEATLTTAKLVGWFVDVTEIRALLAEKKIQIKEPKEEEDSTPPKKESTPAISPIDPPKKVDAPPPVKVADPTPPPPKVDETPAPSAADEKAASDKLRSAKLFSTGEDNRSVYMARLKEIVSKWPATAAGKEAKKLLDGLK